MFGHVEEFENLVKIFYSNARKIPLPGKSGKFYKNSLCTHILGEEYVIDKNVIAKALDIADEGVELDSF